MMHYVNDFEPNVVRDYVSITEAVRLSLLYKRGMVDTEISFRPLFSVFRSQDRRRWGPLLYSIEAGLYCTPARAFEIFGVIRS